MTTVHKFESNADVSGTEAIWSAGGEYPFPTAFAPTTLISDSINDAAGGTGARKVLVIGQDENGIEIEQTVIPNGQNAVALPIDISICPRSKVLIPPGPEANG